MDQERERAALVALLRRGDRSWPDLTDQIETVGSAREVLDSTLDSSGQAALFDTGPAADLEAVAAEIAAWEREGMRLVTILDEDYALYLRLVHQRPPFLFLGGRPLHGAHLPHHPSASHRRTILRRDPHMRRDNVPSVTSVTCAS
ncbi:hypothetical protein ACWDAZ_16485 [Streptomyces sp. NPDC001215]